MSQIFSAFAPVRTRGEGDGEKKGLAHKIGLSEGVATNMVVAKTKILASALFSHQYTNFKVFSLKREDRNSCKLSFFSVILKIDTSSAITFTTTARAQAAQQQKLMTINMHNNCSVVDDHAAGWWRSKRGRILVAQKLKTL